MYHHMPCQQVCLTLLKCHILEDGGYQTNFGGTEIIIRYHPDDFLGGKYITVGNIRIIKGEWSQEVWVLSVSIMGWKWSSFGGQKYSGKGSDGLGGIQIHYGGKFYFHTVMVYCTLSTIGSVTCHNGLADWIENQRNFKHPPDWVQLAAWGVVQWIDTVHSHH